MSTQAQRGGDSHGSRTQHVWGYISDYLDAALPEDIRLDVQKHLEHCEICSPFWAPLGNIIILTADERVFKLPIALLPSMAVMPSVKRGPTGYYLH